MLKGNLNYKSEDQISAIKYIKKLYSGRQTVIKFYNDYTRILFEAKYKSTHGEGIKILTPKEMLERLAIAPAQVKTGNTSENLLNEIRRMIYSLDLAKKITKSVYNIIMNSIKL